MRSILIVAALAACSGGDVTLRRSGTDPNLVVTSLVVAPSAPTTATPLVATAEGTAPDGVTLAFRYAWSVDGAIVQDGDAATLGADRFVRDQVVTLEVTPFRDRREGAPVLSDPIRILNARPTLSGARLGPAVATSADRLVCEPLEPADADADQVSIRYGWEIDGRPLELDSPTLAAGAARRGQSVVCVATPLDGRDAGEPVRSNAVVIANGAPAITSVAIQPQPAFTTSTLSASAVASDPDGDAFGLAWSWAVNGTDVATGSALPASFFRRGDTIVATVVASDGADTSAPASSAPLVVRNSVPTVPAVALGPSDARALRDLVCRITTPSTDADADRVTYVFDFFRDGDPYTGPTTTTVVTGDTVPGDRVGADEVWSCAAAAWDRTDLSRWSAESAPVLTGPPIIEVDITLSDLLNQGNDCSSGRGHRYNDCSTAYGFSWVDPNTVAPRSIEVLYRHGINCGSVATRSATLNGAALGPAPTGAASNCACDASAGTWRVGEVFDTPESYRPDERNTFLMSAVSCEGFSPDPDWVLGDGTAVYARVLLYY
jgi:hypothetical protein